MAIGERIRFFRNMKGITQKYLGMVVGFPERSADVRMAQYETGSRTPKADLTKTLADFFDISPDALTVPDIDTDIGLMHTLFALEDIRGLTIGEIDGEVCLRLDKSKGKTYANMLDMLSAWAEQAKKLEEKLRKNRLTLTDYLDQMEQLQNMGDLSQIAGMLPGNLGKQLDASQIDEKQMAHTKAIILSMTPLEREKPQSLNASRKRRIAAGCGLQVVDVNRLLKSFEMLQQLTKSMSKGRFRGIPGMGGMPGMGGRGKMQGFGRKKRLK